MAIVIDFTTIRVYVSYFFLLFGSFDILVGMIGLIRLPDVYNRLHATTKIATMGACFVLLSILIRDGFTPFGLKAIAVGAFLILTAPVAGHVIARVAYNSNVPPCDQTIFDAYSGKRQGDYCDDYDFHEGSYTYLNFENRDKETEHEYSDQYIENLTEQFSRELTGLTQHLVELDIDFDEDEDEEEETKDELDTELVTGVESTEHASKKSEGRTSSEEEEESDEFDDGDDDEDEKGKNDLD